MPSLPEKHSYSELGGSREDYAPISSARTDYSADQINASLCFTAMASRTQPLAIVSFSPGIPPTTRFYESVWKASTPTPVSIVRSGGGDYLVTLPTSVLDERGDSHYVNIRAASVSVGGPGLGFAKTDITSASSVRVALYSTAFVLDDIDSDLVITLVVF